MTPRPPLTGYSNDKTLVANNRSRPIWAEGARRTRNVYDLRSAGSAELAHATNHCEP